MSDLRVVQFGGSWLVKDGDNEILVVRPTEADAIDAMRYLGSLMVKLDADRAAGKVNFWP